MPRASATRNLSTDFLELDELLEIGAFTAENIVEYRRHSGAFRSVGELASVPNYENRELRFSALLTRAGAELELARL